MTIDKNQQQKLKTITRKCRNLKSNQIYLFHHNQATSNYEWLSGCRRPLYGTLNTWTDETDRREIKNH